MATVLSKRQQARNEKALQELLHSVPGNNQCADCQARNPSWASWSLGIFLCIRCAAIHRKLGTHISKVKSLSMDAWTNEQVDNMKKIGNVKSNERVSPQNKQKPQLPIDTDEADSVMERYIRKKYAEVPAPPSQMMPRRLTDSDDEQPPPLPPKSPTGARINLRSASNIFPLTSRAKREAAASTIRADTAAAPRSHANKPSQVFGATVSYDAGDDTDRKIAMLHDQGFGDPQRNAAVLKSVGGNLDLAMDALVRLAEPSPLYTAAPANGMSRGMPAFDPASSATSNGTGPQSRDRLATPSTVSTTTNPFDVLPPQPQSAHSTGTLQNIKSEDQLPARPVVISQAFGNLSLGAPSQPLFPNHTGGFPAPHLNPEPPYQQSMTPPVSSHPYMSPFGGLQHHQSQLRPLQPQNTANPFYNHLGQNQNQNQNQGQLLGLGLQTGASQQAQQPQFQNLAANTPAGNPNTSNPFARSPTRQTPQLGQIPEQSQPAAYSRPQYLVQQQTAQSMNPFTNVQLQHHQQQQLQQQHQQHQQHQQIQHQQYQPQECPQHIQQLSPQQQYQYQYQQQRYQDPSLMYTAQRPDKASIMALFNYPQLAPRPRDPAAADAAAAAINVPPAAQQQPRSVSTPIPGSNNPFSVTPASPSGILNGFAGVDAPVHKNQPQRDSVAIGMELAWTNGRHSPDAFASLSARNG